MWNDRTRRYSRAVAVGLVTAAVVGIPTDVLDTDYFTRMTPVRWWEYPVLTLTAVLTGLWAAIPRATDDRRGQGKVAGAVTTTLIAVGCPVCNKVVIGLLGVSGALGVWAPIQPVLAILSLAALAASVVVRWRRRTCTPDTCAAPRTPSPAAGEQHHQPRRRFSPSRSSSDSRSDAERAKSSSTASGSPELSSTARTARTATSA